MRVQQPFYITFGKCLQKALLQHDTDDKFINSVNPRVRRQIPQNRIIKGQNSILRLKFHMKPLGAEGLLEEDDMLVKHRLEEMELEEVKGELREALKKFYHKKRQVTST